MERLGPEAALLSARLAEIRVLAGPDRTLYVEAADFARKPEFGGTVRRSDGPGLWAWIRRAPAEKHRARARREAADASAAAIPTLLRAPGGASGEEERLPLAVLPARAPSSP